MYAERIHAYVERLRETLHIYEYTEMIYIYVDRLSTYTYTYSN